VATIGGGSSNGSFLDNIVGGLVLALPTLLSYFVFNLLYKKRIKWLNALLLVITLIPGLWVLLFILPF
jgi:multisubunit Na+/H+ antiporter MnhB subunit